MLEETAFEFRGLGTPTHIGPWECHFYQTVGNIETGSAEFVRNYHACQILYQIFKLSLDYLVEIKKV